MTADMDAFVAAAAAGETLSEIAAAAGVSVSTVQRRLRDPEVRSEIRQIQAERRLLLVGRLGQLHELASLHLK